MTDEIEKCEVCHSEKKKSELIDKDGCLVCPDCLDEIEQCFWCEQFAPRTDLKKTDKGYLCGKCLSYLISRGEKIIVIYNDD